MIIPTWGGVDAGDDGMPQRLPRNAPGSSRNSLRERGQLRERETVAKPLAPNGLECSLPADMAERQVVSFNYVLRDQSGEVLDSSGQGQSITFLEGSGMIIDGLEKALRSMAVGEQRKVALAPEQAYGLRDEQQVQKVNRSALPVDELEVGAMFQAGEDRHSPVVRVAQIDGDEVTLDANHPLAGQRLFFEVELLIRRPATAEEVAHGHVHGPGGHHH